MLSYLAQPRWIPWHLFCAAAFAGCLLAAWWQWQAATAPQPAGADIATWRNYAYALNWLIFAGVAIWFWWRFPRDQRRSESGDQSANVQQTVTPQGRFDPFSDDR